MTEQMKELFSRANGVCFIGWIIMGLYLGSRSLIVSSILLAFFILVMQSTTTLSCVLAILGSAVLGYAFS